MPQSTVDRAHLGRIRRRLKAMRSAQSYSESPGGRLETVWFDLDLDPLPTTTTAATTTMTTMFEHDKDVLR